MTGKILATLTGTSRQAVEVLAERLEMPPTEVIRDALSLYWWVARERSTGTRLLVQRGAEVTELGNPTLDRLASGPPIPSLGAEDPA